MGFKKQGISIMLLFWGSIALASITGLGWLAMFLPVIWFYSFFNVHNLKSLSEEEFYSVDDNYILHMDQFSGNMGKFLQKHRNVTAWVLILFGICILWSRFTALLYLIIPDDLSHYAYEICNSLPQIVIATGIIVAGIYLLTQQKKKLEKEENKDEHYWEPYRPYQQPVKNLNVSSSDEQVPETDSTETSPAPVTEKDTSNNNNPVQSEK